MASFPNQIHEVSGNHRVAIDRTKDIQKYVDEAVAYLTRAYDENCGPFARAGLVRQGDDYLDTIIRFAKCAKNELRKAYIAVDERDTPQ